MNNTNTIQDRLDLRDATWLAIYLGVSERKLRSDLEHGRVDIPFLNLGRRKYFRESDIQTWVEKQFKVAI